ncbi:hypothetical protein C8J57DRAFT_1522682 [Mycena rebaudengoi]|nr:hypothetical protein C8J57DRAFT_1522682 [Mycena rebaudengoi]
MLGLVSTLIQLYDYQEEIWKSVPGEKQLACLRLYDSFCGLKSGIPNAVHLFLIPSSVLPQTSITWLASYTPAAYRKRSRSNSQKCYATIQKEDVGYLTTQFQSQKINEDALAQSSTQKFGNLLTGVIKGFTANLIIYRTTRSKQYDSNQISQDLPASTQVHVKVTLTPVELESALETMGEDNVMKAVKGTGCGGGNFFLATRKESAYHGATNIATSILAEYMFPDLRTLNAWLCMKLKTLLLLTQKILTSGAANFFIEEIGLDSLIKSDQEMGVQVDSVHPIFETIATAQMTVLAVVLM